MRVPSDHRCRHQLVMDGACTELQILCKVRSAKAGARQISRVVGPWFSESTNLAPQFLAFGLSLPLQICQLSWWLKQKERIRCQVMNDQGCDIVASELEPKRCCIIDDTATLHVRRRRVPNFSNFHALYSSFWLQTISFFYSSLVILCAAHLSFGYPRTFTLFLSQPCLFLVIMRAAFLQLLPFAHMSQL